MRVLSSASSDRFSDEVAREEHDEDHLQELRGLAGERPDRERQARAVDVAAEHERRQQEPDADRRPRVLVGPQPGVGADADREHRDHPEREQQPAQLELAEGELGDPKCCTTMSCGRRCISSRPIPPSIPIAGKQDLVRAPAREHEQRGARAPSAAR